jgi:periplasmic protein TonB
MHGDMRPDGASNRRLTYAIGASLALHGALLLVAAPREGPSPKEPVPETLTARLVTPVPQTPAPQASTPSGPATPAPPPAEASQPAPKADMAPLPKAQPKKRQPQPKPRTPAKSPAKPSDQAAPPPASARPAPQVETPQSAAAPLPSPEPVPSPPLDTLTPQGAPPSAAPSSTPAEATADAGSLEGYRRDLLDMAARYKRYPLVARDNNWEGMATVRLAIGANGMIDSLAIAQSSGHDVLDRAAIDMIRKAKGAVLIPAALRGKPFVLTIPVLYEIKAPGGG